VNLLESGRPSLARPRRIVRAARAIAVEEGVDLTELDKEVR